MKLTIQILTNDGEARKFIRGMTSQGYEAHEVERDGIIDVHFTIQGKTSADYSVMIADEVAYIGVRPQ